MIQLNSYSITLAVGGIPTRAESDQQARRAGVSLAFDSPSEWHWELKAISQDNLRYSGLPDGLTLKCVVERSDVVTWTIEEPNEVENWSVYVDIQLEIDAACSAEATENAFKLLGLEHQWDFSESDILESLARLEGAEPTAFKRSPAVKRASWLEWKQQKTSSIIDRACLALAGDVGSLLRVSTIVSVTDRYRIHFFFRTNGEDKYPGRYRRIDVDALENGNCEHLLRQLFVGSSVKAAWKNHALFCENILQLAYWGYFRGGEWLFGPGGVSQYVLERELVRTSRLD